MEVERKREGGKEGKRKGERKGIRERKRQNNLIMLFYFCFVHVELSLKCSQQPVSSPGYMILRNCLCMPSRVRCSPLKKRWVSSVRNSKKARFA